MAELRACEPKHAKWPWRPSFAVPPISSQAVELRLHQGLHFRGLLHHSKYSINRADPRAVIDSPSFPTVPTSSPSRPNPGPASQTTSRPTRRRSNITSQIYQFALGYPQTPPEISPELDSINSVQQTEAPFASGMMASFLFKWYATAVSLDRLCPSQCPTVYRA